jgi:hypothetical protein
MTSSRRLSAAYKSHKPSRTKSSKAKVYIAVPPKTGWPVFTGSNWAAMGLRNKGNK